MPTRAVSSLITEFHHPIALREKKPLKNHMAYFHTSEMLFGREIVKRAQKLEKSRERSAELLKALRKKRLEGLTNPQPHMTAEEKVLKGYIGYPR